MPTALLAADASADLPTRVSSAIILLLVGWSVGGLLAYAVLRVWSQRLAGRLRDRLYNLVKRFSVPPDRDSDRHLHDEIDVLLTAVRETASDRSPTRVADRRELVRWIADRDADKPDMTGFGLERLASFARVQIEALPLAGICGTLLRMYWALSLGPSAAADSSAESVSANSLSILTGQFGDALLSTLVALVGTIMLMWANAWLEPNLERLIQQRAEFREVVATARRRLADVGPDSDVPMAVTGLRKEAAA